MLTYRWRSSPKISGAPFRLCHCWALPAAISRIPHKEDALRAVDEYEPSAKRAGGVNTIVIRPNGTILGSSTDGFGFIAALRADAPDFSAGAGPAVVLGAGGAARAIVAALLDEGAREVRLVNRTPERAAKLAKELGGEVRGVPWDARAEALVGAGLLVNATSLGMEGQPRARPAARQSAAAPRS